MPCSGVSPAGAPYLLPLPTFLRGGRCWEGEAAGRLLRPGELRLGQLRLPRQGAVAGGTTADACCSRLWRVRVQGQGAGLAGSGECSFSGCTRWPFPLAGWREGKCALRLFSCFTMTPVSWVRAPPSCPPALEGSLLGGTGGELGEVSGH